MCRLFEVRECVGNSANREDIDWKNRQSDSGCCEEQILSNVFSTEDCASCKHSVNGCYQ